MIFQINSLNYIQVQTLSTLNQATILSGIGSIYILVFGVLQLVNNYLTKNSEDVTMANQLYKVKNDRDPTLVGSDKQQVVTTIQAR